MIFNQELYNYCRSLEIWGVGVGNVWDEKCLRWLGGDLVFIHKIHRNIKPSVKNGVKPIIFLLSIRIEVYLVQILPWENSRRDFNPMTIISYCWRLLIKLSRFSEVVISIRVRIPATSNEWFTGWLLYLSPIWNDVVSCYEEY